MTPAEALADIRGYATAGRYQITDHAYDRMDKRGVKEQELVGALCHAHGCRREPGPGERWRALGQDRDGDLLEVIVAIEHGLLVITVF